MNKKVDIHKAAGVLIKDKKFLTTRAKGKDYFISPGGKVEKGEAVTDALVRELKEELGIDVNISALEPLETYYAQAIGQEDKTLQLDVFIVSYWSGDIIPQAEVEEVAWINSNTLSVTLGSIFQHDVLPELKKRGLID